MHFVKLIQNGRMKIYYVILKNQSIFTFSILDVSSFEKEKTNMASLLYVELKYSDKDVLLII